MKDAKKTNWRRHDYRSKSLYMVIYGLSKSIDELEKNINEVHWYDGDWFMEESEPIYGLAFIAMQNYINGSISDIYGLTKNKNIIYKKDSLIKGFDRTKIELVIALANYSKHKEEGIPHQGTLATLNSFNLKFNVIYLDEAVIFPGLAILDNDYNLFSIMNHIFNWRELLWSEIE